MARELGLNPKKLGGMANHNQEPWKAPLPEYIEYLYQQRFRKERPDLVLSIEEVLERDQKKKAEGTEKERLERLESERQQETQEASRGRRMAARPVPLRDCALHPLTF